MVQAKYHEFGGPSGVDAYELGDDWIILYFQNGTAYRYTYASCGEVACERMKQLAEQGANLNTFVNQAHPAFASKTP